MNPKRRAMHLIIFNKVEYDREIRMETQGRGIGNGFTCLCPWQDNSPQVQTF